MQIDISKYKDLKKNLNDIFKRHAPEDESSTTYCVAWLEAKYIIKDIPNDNLEYIEFLTDKPIETDSDFLIEFSKYMNKMSNSFECKVDNLYNEVSKKLMNLVKHKEFEDNGKLQA